MHTLSCAPVSGLPCGFVAKDLDEGNVRRRFWAHMETAHPDLAFGMGERRNDEWQRRIDSLLRDNAPSTHGGRLRAPGRTPPTDPLTTQSPDPRPTDPASTPRSLRRTR